MYSYIKGTIEEIRLDSIVIENNNIGYKINVSSNTIKTRIFGSSSSSLQNVKSHKYKLISL